MTDVTVINTVGPKNDGDFAVVRDTQILGGFRSVADETERDAITTERRVEGMRVYVRSTSKLYELSGGTSNADWHLVLADGAITLENITIPVDDDDGGGGSVGNPPDGTVWVTQAQVDDFLADNSFTAVEKLQSAWDSIPKNLGGNLTINIASGRNRPAATSTDGTHAWNLTGKSIVNPGAEITISGDTDTSTWDIIVSANTITSHDATLGTPSVTVAGAPFGAAGSLKNYFAIISGTGQITAIMDNTSDTLELVGGFAMVGPPTNGVDTVTVARPGTILVNSLDDSTPDKDSMIQINAVSVQDQVNLNALTIEHYSNFLAPAVDAQNCTLDCTNVLIDASVNTSANGHGFRLAGPIVWNPTSCCVRASGATSFDNAIEANFQAGGIFFTAVEFSADGGSGPDGILLQGTGTGARFFSLVLDGMPMRVLDGSAVDLSGFSNFFGRQPTIRNCTTGTGALELGLNTHLLLLSSPPSQRCEFEGNSIDCVYIGGNVMLADTPLVFANVSGGAANTSHGINLDKAYSLLELSAGTDVSGSLGDVLIQGVATAYGSIGTIASPTRDADFNIIGVG